ncbi:hypothetical protein JCM11641_008442 [Rhodosporidiobolus odoratus]
MSEVDDLDGTPRPDSTTQTLLSAGETPSKGDDEPRADDRENLQANPNSLISPAAADSAFSADPDGPGYDPSSCLARGSPRVPRHPRPLSSISRLSRRSTVCLSTLSIYSLAASFAEPEAIGSSDEEVESKETDGTRLDPDSHLDLIVAAKDALDETYPAPAEATRQERELLNRILGDEIETVRQEVEEAVQSATEEEKAKSGSESEARITREAHRSEGRWVELDATASPTTLNGAFDGLTGQAKVGTFFSGPTGQTFRRIPSTRAGVDTAAFLTAMESIVAMGELLAPTAATLCAGEIISDIQVCHLYYSAHRSGSASVAYPGPSQCVRYPLSAYPASSETLEQLLLSERKERRRPASDSLIWLIRLLNYGATSLRRSLDNPEEELSESLTRVWDEGISKHVNWLVRPLFKVIVRASPSRSAVFSRLAQGASLEQAEKGMGEWLEDVEKIVRGLEAWGRRKDVGVKVL